jgi:hypothetical protein
MADKKPTNQDQSPSGKGNPSEEGTDSGTGALDDEIRNTKDRATGADEPAPRGQGSESVPEGKKAKPGEEITAASVSHGGKIHPAGTPLRTMNLDKDQAADLKRRGHVTKAPETSAE